MLNELFIQRWKMLRRLPPPISREPQFHRHSVLSYTFNFLKDTGALADRFHWFTKERWHLIKLVHVPTPQQTHNIFPFYFVVYNDTTATADRKEALAVCSRPSLQCTRPTERYNLGFLVGKDEGSMRSSAAALLRFPLNSATLMPWVTAAGNSKTLIVGQSVLIDSR